MLTNFGNAELPNMEVELVMAQIKGDEPSEHLQITFVEGNLENESMLLGEWNFLGSDENGADVEFNVVFVGKTPEETDILVADNHELIRSIALTLIENAANVANEFLGEDNE